MTDLYGIAAFEADPSLPANVFAVIEPILAWKRESAPCARIPIAGWIDRNAVIGLPCTTLDRIRADLQRSLADDKIACILLEVDSAGGSFPGVDELADEMREARKQKPIVAHTASRAESAAYWLAAQASRVLADSRATVGAIGVVHTSGQVSVPGKSSLGWRRRPQEVHTTEQRAAIQTVVDAAHERFVAAIELGRQVAYVKACAMADGHRYFGDEAVHRGFLDGICSRMDAVRIALDLARARAEQHANHEPGTGIRP